MGSIWNRKYAVGKNMDYLSTNFTGVYLQIDTSYEPLSQTRYVIFAQHGRFIKFVSAILQHQGNVRFISCYVRKCEIRLPKYDRKKSLKIDFTCRKNIGG